MNEHMLERRLDSRGAQLFSFSSRGSLDQTLCDDICTVLSAAVTARGEASLVLPGGSTPRGLLSLLAISELDWSRITVLLSDERWLPADHVDSNERQLRELLLTAGAAEARFLPLRSDVSSVEAGAEVADAELSAIPRFDCVVLGMGTDGHTASLFPDSAQLSDGLALNGRHSCIAVQTPSSPYERLTLTLPRLLNCEQLILHICGEDKRSVLSDALFAVKPPPVARLFGAGDCRKTVYWAP